MKTLWTTPEESFVKVAPQVWSQHNSKQISKIHSGCFDVFARGITSIDFLKKTRYRVEVKAVEKVVHFKETENNKTLMTLSDLHDSNVQIEKSIEDPKVLWLYGHKDESGEKNCEIIFSSNVERDYFYLVIHQLMGTPHQRRISMWMGTWNLGSAAPPALDAWIPSPNDRAYDMYIVGVQVPLLPL